MRGGREEKSILDKSLEKNFKINVKRFLRIRALISKLKVERGIEINALVPLYTQANKKCKQSKSTSKQVKKYKKLICNICKSREVNRSSKKVYW